MKTKTEQMYATMNPWRLFFIVAMPGMVSMFAMSIYSVVEGIFIGQILGEGAFAAVNIAMPLVMINFSLADLIGVGASAPISIALGENDRKTANNVFSCSVIMIFIVSIFMGSVMFFAAEPLSRLMGADSVLLDTSVRYLRTAALCSPLAAIFFAMDNYLRISGFVKTSMVINIGCNLLTLALLTFFLLVCDMDVVGSALATSISMCACAVVAMIPFVMKKALLKFVKPEFSFSIIKRIAACGSPVFLNNVSGRITSILMNISLMTLGAKILGEGGGQTAVAVYAVLMYSSDLCWPLLYGISDSLSPALGYNWGAKNYRRVKRIVRCGYIGTAIVGLVSTSILFFFPDMIASWFVKAEDVRLLEISTHAIRIFCFAYLFRWVGVSTQGYFTAIGKPLDATIISIGTAFVFPVVLMGALWRFGLDGIWFNFVGVTALAAMLSAILLIRLTKEIRQKESDIENNITEV
ncbi:MAG: MATE family efflux transporter [Ruminococcaceae bacterium]|nr:MATE family efflux transporter [Oscillospiraceae bacterium]